MTRNFKKVLLNSFLLIVSIFISYPVYAGSGWLIYRESAFRGIVIDAETKETVEGAVVVAQYHVDTWGPVHGSTDLIDVREALTNRKGEFYIPALKKLINPLSVGYFTSFLIWKPGYKPVEEPPAIMGEFFFSQEPGTMGSRKVYTDSGIEIVPMKLGIVKIHKVKTREERRKASMVGVTGYRSKDLPLFYKALNEEQRYLGIPESE